MSTLAFYVGAIVGVLIGMAVMSLLAVNREETETRKEDKAEDRE